MQRKERERERERERESCKQHSTSVSMAVAQIFTNKTESMGKGGESNRERGIRSSAGIQHLSVSVMLSTKLREKQRGKKGLGA